MTNVAAVDLNGDGKGDVIGVFAGSLRVYIGKGDGTFASGVSYGAAPVGLLSLGDFNGDGKIDVAFSTGQQTVFLGNGDGTLQVPPRTSSGAPFPDYVTTGDFDGDAKLDIATSSAGSVYIQMGKGDGTFQPATTAFSSNGPIAAADVNGDGRLDLVLVTVTVGPLPSPLSPSSAEIHLGNGDGTFSSPNYYGISIAGGGTATIAIADLNGDGKSDVIADFGCCGSGTAPGSILLGNGNGTFRGIDWGSTGSLLPAATALGDFEKKGALDVAVLSSNSLLILSNNGSGGLSLIHTYTLQQNDFAIVAADFNGDGDIDLAVVGIDPVSAAWSYSVLLGSGDGSFQSPNIYTQSGGSPESVVMADFNNDHKPDLAVSFGATSSNNSNSVAILLGNGNGSFAPPVYYYNAGFGSLNVADFNGDGKLDLASSGNDPNTSSPETGILFGNGDGTFQPLIVPASLNSFAEAFTADLNDDGKADLISVNQVALGNRDGTFTVLPPFPASLCSGFPCPLNAISDLNGDGNPDLLVTVSSGSHPGDTAILMGNGDGTFGSAISVTPFGVITGPILIADMNNDGRPDIVFPWVNVQFLCGLCVPTPTGVGVLVNTTPADFHVFAGPMSPATVTAGNSAISTVSVTPTFGFSSSVTLSCAGLPGGATCAFNPPTIANSSGTSMLTIATTTVTTAGTYPVQVTGSAGAIVNSSAVSLVVQAAPDFSANPGSPASQTVSGGQTASFSLSLAGSGTFSGTVNLGCAITPVVTLGPTCSLSSSSEQISGTTAQSVAVKVGTTAPSTAAMLSPIGPPPGSLPWGWTFLCTMMLVGFGGVALQSRKRAPVLVAPVLVLAVLSWVACGGSSSPHNTQGTPAGTYTATVTATSGSLSHATVFKVTVQ